MLPNNNGVPSRPRMSAASSRACPLEDNAQKRGFCGSHAPSQPISIVFSLIPNKDGRVWVWVRVRVVSRHAGLVQQRDVVCFETKKAPRGQALTGVGGTRLPRTQTDSIGDGWYEKPLTQSMWGGEGNHPVCHIQSAIAATSDRHYFDSSEEISDKTKIMKPMPSPPDELPPVANERLWTPTTWSSLDAQFVSPRSYRERKNVPTKIK